LVFEWLSLVAQDFAALTPTEQATFAIGGVTFAFAALAGGWKTIKVLRRSDDAPPITPDDLELTRILKLIETKKLSGEDAVALGQAFLRDTIADDGLTDAGQGIAPASEGLRPLVEEDEDRRAFSKLVQELAMSDEMADREVILKYARGDRQSALATLAAQAEAAGAEGADKWHEVAVFATPFDHDRAIGALKKATTLKPDDAVSHCRLSRLLLSDDDIDGAIAAADAAMTCAKDKATKARAMMRKGLATAQGGDVRSASQLIDTALDTARAAAAADASNEDTVRALANTYEAQSIVRADMGSPIEAAAALDRASSLYEELLKFSPDDEDLMLERLRARLRQGYLLRVSDDPEGACDIYSRLLPEYDDALAKRPDNRLIAQDKVAAILDWAFALDALSDESRAIAKLDQIESLINTLLPVAVRPDELRSHRIWSGILRARILTRQGHVAEAIELQDKVLSDARQAADTGRSSAIRNLSIALEGVGSLRAELGNAMGAENSLHEACDLVAKRASEDPGNVSKQEDAILIQWKLAAFAKDQMDVGRYFDLVRDTHETVQNLASSFPGKTHLRVLLAHSHRLMADAYVQRNEDSDHAAALEQSEQGCRLYRVLAQLNPNDFKTVHGELDSDRIHAAFLVSEGRLSEGLALAESALRKCDAMATTNEKAARLAVAKSRCHVTIAGAYREMNEYEKAVLQHQKAVGILHKHFAHGDKIRSRRHSYMDGLIAYGDLLVSAEKSDLAEQQYLKALDLVDRSANAPDRREERYELVLKSKLQFVSRSMGNLDTSRRYQADALALAEEQAEYPEDVVAQQNLARAYVGEAAEAIRDHDLVTAKVWIGRAKTVAARVVDNPEVAISVELGIREQQLILAAQSDDHAACKEHIDRLVELKQMQLDRRWTRDNQLALYDLLLRQAAQHYRFGKPDHLLPDLVGKLEQADGDQGGKQLSRARLATLWFRLGHIYSPRHLHREAAMAFAKSIDLREGSDNASQLYSLASTHVDHAKSLESMGNIQSAIQETENAEALLPAVRSAVDDPCFALELEAGVAQSWAAIALFQGNATAARSALNSAFQAIKSLANLRPNNPNPPLHEFAIRLSELDAADIDGDPDRRKSLLQAIRQAGDKALELSEKKTYIAACVDNYLAVQQIILSTDTGGANDALDHAVAIEEPLCRAAEEPTSHFLPQVKSMFYIAASEAALAAKDVDQTRHFTEQAVNECALLAGFAPDDWVYACQHLRSLHVKARATNDDDDFTAVRTRLTELEERGMLPKHHPWLTRLLADGRV